MMSQDPQGSPSCFFVSLGDYHYFLITLGLRLTLPLISLGSTLTVEEVL